MIFVDECNLNFLIFVPQLKNDEKKKTTTNLIRPGIEPGPALSRNDSLKKLRSYISELGTTYYYILIHKSEKFVLG